MKTYFVILAFLPVFHLKAAEEKFIRISTNETDLILQVASDGRLYQTYLGDKLANESEFGKLPYALGNVPSGASPHKREVYPCSGTEDYFEPAFAIRHHDGNRTAVLKYVSAEEKRIDGNVTETVVFMKDEVYPVAVTLHYTSFAKENIIKSRTEIRHKEKSPVIISRYASSMLYFDSPEYFLTEFTGDWAREVHETTGKLSFGKKVIDTKLGSRAGMFASPFFEIGLGEKPQENAGEVLMGTIAWIGNFQFTFEIDQAKNLRVISGINPYASEYELNPGEVFTTPEFIFTRSNRGTGKASRNFHSWARNYQLKDGKDDRMTLLNNWEATYFSFDREKLKDLMKEAKELGVDLFLLDDGWFGNKYPRSNDQTSLGDWEVTPGKLPGGVPELVKSAAETGIKFGIWIEPEMVSVKSELYEKHPDWAIALPNRTPYFFRNQLVLDMSNPAVQDYVFGVVDHLMAGNPGLAFFKWDCNSPITNIYSPYLKEKQNQLYINHARGIYSVFNRIKDKYPNLPMMLCSGGGARCDYESMKYFTEFWCSDNTDPIERLYIQWGFSRFFPSKAMCAHVTSWNKNAGIKFRTDVAMMCKLGFDIRLNEMSRNEMLYCRGAVSNYNRLKKIILDGDLYRIVSPYDGNHTAVMYTNETKDKAVLFAYDVFPRFDEKLFTVKLEGLDPDKRYKLEEINLMPETKSSFGFNGQSFSGDYLMKIGLNVFSTSKLSSKIIEITAE